VTGSILIGNNAEQKSAKPKVQTQGDRDFEAVRTHGVMSGIPRRNGNCFGSINNLFGGMGGADNYSYDELQELGKEFLNK